MLRNKHQIIRFRWVVTARLILVNKTVRIRYLKQSSILNGRLQQDLTYSGKVNKSPSRIFRQFNSLFGISSANKWQTLRSDRTDSVQIRYNPDFYKGSIQQFYSTFTR